MPQEIASCHFTDLVPFRLKPFCVSVGKKRKRKEK